MRLAICIAMLAACWTGPASDPEAPRTIQTVDKREERAPAPLPARLSTSAVAATLTPDVVLATIRGRYLSGVERCYRRHLKKNAGARGVVTVSFAVDAKGRAREGAARGITERVDECITAQVRRWRFPVARGHREARFALGLELGVN